MNSFRAIHLLLVAVDFEDRVRTDTMRCRDAFPRLTNENEGRRKEESGEEKARE